MERQESRIDQALFDRACAFVAAAGSRARQPHAAVEHPHVSMELGFGIGLDCHFVRSWRCCFKTSGHHKIDVRQFFDGILGVLICRSPRRQRSAFPSATPGRARRRRGVAAPFLQGDQAIQAIQAFNKNALFHTSEKKMKTILAACALAAISMLSGCATVPDGTVYRGGVIVHEEPLDIQDAFSFRFVEQWRISHKWFAGPLSVRGCRYAGNPFRVLPGYAELAKEKNAPMLRWGEILAPAEDDNRQHPLGMQFRLMDEVGSDTYTLGTERGQFVRFGVRCSANLKPTRTAFTLYIIKPASEKGTDAWIANATRVVVNGRTWLAQTTPPPDLGITMDKEERSLLERWVLAIPETDYWLVLAKRSGFKAEGLEMPPADKEVDALFRQVIASVTLEPIDAVIDQKTMIVPEKCVQLQPHWGVNCPFNIKSIGALRRR